MRKLLPLLVFLAFCLPSGANATAYYIDFECHTTATCGNGLATTTSFSSVDEFADAARTAGDIAFVRRGVASTTNVTTVDFTSDGTLNAPIVITADYDNLWGSFATSSVTGTLAFGNNYIATSASTTDLAVGDWIYVAGDCYETYNSTTLNQCAYAYEVQSASSTGIQLYLPYKGQQSGAALSLRIMPNAPQVGLASTAVQIFPSSSDDYWVIKGLDARSTSSSCVVSSSNAKGFIYFDVVLQGNGSGDCGVQGTSGPGTRFTKGRIFNVASGYGSNNGAYVVDSLIDCNSVANSDAVTTAGIVGGFSYIKDTQVTRCTRAVLNISASVWHTGTLVNVRHLNGFGSLSGGPATTLYLEDDQSVPALNWQSSNQFSGTPTTTMATTTALRSGWGPTNLQVLPSSGTGNTGISTYNFPFSYVKLFEYPIYADTSSKTYTMYFRSASSSAFTVNPLTSTASGSSTPELFIECEYYGAASGAERKLTRSNTASAVNFNTDTNWYGISVTCQPAQSGILYLRGWYAKPRENPTNQFYMDTTPVVS